MMRGTECVHSPAPLFGRRRTARGTRQRLNASAIDPISPSLANKKKGRNRSRFPPCLKHQNSSSMPPWTVWTTRAVRCAGNAL
jgi:hypothetical protein